MTNTSQVAIDLSEHEYLNPIDEKPAIVSTTVEQEPALTTGRKSAIIGLIIFALASAIPILQYYIGRRYSDECPLNWHIPHYLVVAGVVGIVIIILRIIQNVLTLKVPINRAEQTSKIAPTVSLLCILCLIALLLVFLFIWFMFGCIWVFRSWNIVEYDDSNSTNYCHPVLYRFTFWFLVISLIFKILSCGQSCWEIPLELKQLRLVQSRPAVITTTP